MRWLRWVSFTFQPAGYNYIRLRSRLSDLNRYQVMRISVKQKITWRISTCYSSKCLQSWRQVSLLCWRLLSSVNVTKGSRLDHSNRTKQTNQCCLFLLLALKQNGTNNRVKVPPYSIQNPFFLRATHVNQFSLVWREFSWFDVLCSCHPADVLAQWSLVKFSY